ncbi:hypothetical protein SRHO_G00032190 [Serrasalmus rhombeus]
MDSYSCCMENRLLLLAQSSEPFLQQARAGLLRVRSEAVFSEGNGCGPVPITLCTEPLLSLSDDRKGTDG